MVDPAAALTRGLVDEILSEMEGGAI